MVRETRFRATVLKTTKESYSYILPSLFIASDTPGTVEVGKRKRGDSSIEIDGMAMQKMQKTDLVHQLELRGLPVKGLKVELFYRLRESALQELNKRFRESSGAPS